MTAPPSHLSVIFSFGSNLPLTKVSGNMVNFTLEAAPFWGVVFAAFTEGPAVGEEGWFLLELDIFIFDSWSFQQGEGAQFLFRFTECVFRIKVRKVRGRILFVSLVALNI